jgi:phosphoribosylformimino-5-aminoimidazole carboxamide ribotide isomerase
VAEAFRSHFDLTHLYLADLDAIAGTASAVAIYRNLQEHGFTLWVDAGVRDVVDAQPLVGAGVAGIVVGLETVRGPQVLRQLIARFGEERIVFSLDMKDGRPLGDVALWQRPEGESIAREAIAVGVRHLIVLDLARVGVGSGTGTGDLCRCLAIAHPEVELIAGGGVRDAADLRRLAECGVRAALVASALHDGRLVTASY